MDSGSTTFHSKANDPACRDWSYRVHRYVRARLRNICQKGLLWSDDPRVFRAWSRGWDADHYIRLLRWRDNGFRPRVVYDIGAHDGAWAEMCQEVFAPETIYLFEPQSDYQKRARARQPRERADWRVVPVALGDSAGSSTLHVTRNHAASSLLAPLTDQRHSHMAVDPTGTEAVAVVALDEFVGREKLGRPNLVKIDVQGYEGRVLKGGSAVLAAADRLIIEASLRPIYQDQPLFPDVLQTVASWGFHLEDVSEAYRLWPDIRLWQTDLWLIRPS